MCWHTKHNNIIVLAELIKLSTNMALMTVKYKQVIFSNCAVLCMLIKVLKLGKPKLIYYLAILTDRDCLITWDIIIFIPSREVVLP